MYPRGSISSIQRRARLKIEINKKNIEAPIHQKLAFLSVAASSSMATPLKAKKSNNTPNARKPVILRIWNMVLFKGGSGYFIGVCIRKDNVGLECFCGPEFHGSI